MKRRIVVLGGGYAGLLCALRLARKTPARITLATARPWFVERVRLHQDVAGSPTVRRPFAKLLAGSGVELLVGHVDAIDLATRRLSIGASEEAFDDLVLATGSIEARRIAGSCEAFSCASEERANELRVRLAESSGGRVVIVGGGLTGIELAAELGERRTDLRVTLVSADAVGPGLSDDIRDHVRRALATKRVTLIENQRVAALERGSVVLESGTEIASDVSIVASGFLASPLARRARLAVDPSGRAIVDATLRSTSHPFVHVIGDAACVHAGGSELRMACATAMPMGAFAADDIARDLAGEPRPRFGFAFAAQCISLGRKDGAIQRLDPHDAPLRKFATGRLGAWIKEGICLYTMIAMEAERRGFSYRWPGMRTPRATMTLLEQA